MCNQPVLSLFQLSVLFWTLLFPPHCLVCLHSQSSCSEDLYCFAACDCICNGSPSSMNACCESTSDGGNANIEAASLPAGEPTCPNCKWLQSQRISCVLSATSHDTNLDSCSVVSTFVPMLADCSLNVKVNAAASRPESLRSTKPLYLRI